MNGQMVPVRKLDLTKQKGDGACLVIGKLKEGVGL
jgi:hypothetical protein